MLKKRRFLAVNSSISGGAGSKLQLETCTVSFGNQSGMQKWLFIDIFACNIPWDRCFCLLAPQGRQILLAELLSVKHS